MTYATIDGFEELTAQQVFDISKNHLLAQKEKSTVDPTSLSSANCKYRGPNGLMCAAGPFLKDGAAESCEGFNWADLVVEGTVPDNNADLISVLQECHDNCKVEHWPEQLKDIAEDFKLVY